MKWYIILGLFFSMSIGGNSTLYAQVNPSVNELHNYFNNQQLLLTYRDG